jgi:uncharacterized protein with GYD domain
MFEEVKKIFADEGAKIVDTYVTLGRYDIVGIIEASDDKTAMKLSALVGATGNVKIETLPAVKMEEFIKAVE